jgi:hypothetical protein
MNDKARFGIYYVATGQRHISEAIQSALSVRACMPDVKIAVSVDDASLLQRSLFDIVSLVDSPTYSVFDKIIPLARTPFEETLFLDTDTVMIEPVYELFPILKRFELAYCHAPYRNAHPWVPVFGCPEAFPEANTGVILYRWCEKVRCVFLSWAAIVKNQRSQVQNECDDQPAFREAVYKSTLNFTILPPEYNYRPIFPAFAGGNMKVKILHGRGSSMRMARRRVNRELSARIADYASLHRSY